MASNSVSDTSRKPDDVVNSSSNSDTPCGHCGPEKSVTLRVENSLVGDHFTHSVTITSQERKLIHFLTKAADQKAEFKFSATYYANLGYFITAMNGLPSDETTYYWNMYDGNGVALPLGVSSYEPQDGQTIVFSCVKMDPCN